jgi:hypothetical protein
MVAIPQAPVSPWFFVDGGVVDDVHEIGDHRGLRYVGVDTVTVYAAVSVRVFKVLQIRGGRHARGDVDGVHSALIHHHIYGISVCVDSPDVVIDY